MKALTGLLVVTSFEVSRQYEELNMNLNIKKDSPLRDKQFQFGVATASFQIEGARESREENIWDRFCQKEGAIADNSNGDFACDHIANWREDVDLITELGVDAYRFSVSWPRVVDDKGKLKPEGVKFYVDLLNELNARGIKPYVTLYHWDLPQYLEELGGWLNRETAYAFKHYVELITREFGERVFSYATLNEPFCSAHLGYELGIHAPGVIGQGKKAAHNLLLAHGLAMQVLQETSPNSLNGIVVNVSPRQPKSESLDDLQAARLANEHLNHWYIKPLFEKQYPEVIDDLPESEYPEIHERDMEIIAAPLDYIGINYYTREIYVSDSKQGFLEVTDKQLPLTDMGWEVYPQGLFEILAELDATYDLPPILITENGAAMKDEVVSGEIIDIERTAYYQSHLAAVEDAIRAGINVKGYFAWSLMDNFEWAEGYVKRFGIVYVDYETQERTIKQSGKAYAEFLKSR